MPRRKNQQLPSKKKELKAKQKIQTRLIEISMKVEDFIYHKKSISELEAERLIREANSYKTECSADERSLQVIEKLTRCMKAIIAEHQELGFNNANNELQSYADDRVNSSSPVYSLPDEDRTQFTQEEVRKPINTAIENQFHNDYHPYEDANRTLFTQASQEFENTNNDNKASQIINLCDDNDYYNLPLSENNTINLAKSRIVAQADMHKALSNLSLHNNQDEPMATDTECSQSILTNFEEPNISTSNANSDINKLVADQADIVYTNILKQLTNQNDTLNSKPVMINRLIVTPPVIVQNSDVNNIKLTKKLNDKTYLVAKVSKAINNTYNIPNNSQIFNKQSNIENVETDFNVTPTNINKTMNVCNIPKNIQKVCIPVSENQATDNTTTIPKVSYSNLAFTSKSTTDNMTVTRNKTANTNVHIATNNTYLAHNKSPKSIPNNKKKIDKSKAVACESSSAIVKKKRAPRKKKIDEAKNFSTGGKGKLESTECKALQTNTINKTGFDIGLSKNMNKNGIRAGPIISIYNKNVENDLSWLENIRFVREIGDDESDRSLLLSENFWENYYLPPNFDESEFDY